MVKKSVLALIVILILLCGCQRQEEAEPAALEGEPFAIYLVGDSQITSPDLKNYALDKIPLNAVPILKTDDLVSYDWEHHGINLTEQAYARLIALFYSGLPSAGVPFVVVAYQEPIFAGGFWSPLSTLSFDGVVILQPFDPAGQTLYIQLGFPDESVFTGADPRDNPRLQQALQDAGLIRE
jgi:uncharacterized lipoprotein NlpE involved in copper resistance